MEVKVFQSMPKLSEIEGYYLELFNLSEGAVSNLFALNSIYHMDEDELYTAIVVVRLIGIEVSNANHSSGSGQRRRDKRP